MPGFFEIVNASTFRERCSYGFLSNEASKNHSSTISVDERMGYLGKIWHTIRGSALRIRGIEIRDIDNIRHDDATEMTVLEDGNAPIKGVAAEGVVTKGFTSREPGSPKNMTLRSVVQRQDVIGALLPEEVALRQLGDRRDPDFRALALEASPAWEHLDPAPIRFMLSQQTWARQMYITQICDIVYCRVTDECYVRWLSAESTPRRIKLIPTAHVDDKDEDNWDASYGPLTPPRTPVCRRWHQTYPATEISVPAKDFKWGRRRAGKPSCIGSRADTCDWVLSKTPDLGKQGPTLMVTIPGGDEYFLVPPQNATGSDSLAN